MKVRPSEIGTWSLSDVCLMLAFYKEKSNAENSKGVEIPDIETMANVLGATE
jgi:hypothetical protein